MQYSRMPVRTVIEHGTKDKRSVAFSLDWPGWSRGAKSAELALETLESYRERYRPVAVLAGMGPEFDAAGPLEVVEEKVGTGSTDFWGISFSPSSTEHGPMDEAEFSRKTTLLRAAWAYFDGVAARVSPEMRKGVRGGGRERDEITRHVFRVESLDFAKQVGLLMPDDGVPSPDAWQQYREAYVATNARVQRRGGRAAHAVVDAPLPHPALCLSHPRPRVGDGGQGPFRRGRGLTHHSSVRRDLGLAAPRLSVGVPVTLACVDPDRQAVRGPW